MKPELQHNEIPFGDVPIGHVFEGWGDYLSYHDRPVWIKAWKDTEHGGIEIEGDDLGVGFCVGEGEPVYYEGEVYRGKYSRLEPSV